MLRLREPGVPQWHGGSDPVPVETRPRAGRTPARVSDLGTERAMNPRRGAIRRSRRKRCARSSLPCVAREGERGGLRPAKPALQKRLRDGSTVAEIA